MAVFFLFIRQFYFFIEFHRMVNPSYGSQSKRVIFFCIIYTKVYIIDRLKMLQKTSTSKKKANKQIRRKLFVYIKYYLIDFKYGYMCACVLWTP